MGVRVFLFALEVVVLPDRVVKGVHVPSMLKPDGRKLWIETLAVYDLSEHERAVLLQACLTVDLCTQLRRKVDREGLTTTGSMGQMVVNPLLQELRNQRALFDKLIRSLALPDIPEQEAVEGGGLRVVPEPNQHRAAAQSKWGKAYG